MEQKRTSKWPEDRRPVGIYLGVSGHVVAAFFVVFIWHGAANGNGWATPLWLGVVLGAVMCVQGFYRRIHGPGKLDYPHGGTNVSD
jgi:hypothetical protein